ncbi:MAG: efflux RND transporter periplasmic adaptor subunit [Pseudomonadales bacterium]
MKLRRWVIIGLVCFCVTAALAAFKVMQIRAAIAFAESFPEPVEAVELAVVEQVSWRPNVSATAEVVAPRDVELSNELAGRIVEVGFEPGATVAASQLLVRFDTSEERARLEAAQAQAELARLVLARNKKLLKTGAAAKEAYDQAVAQRNAALAEERALRAIIAKKTLRASFAAEAGLHQLAVGQYLDAATVITRLVGTGEDIWLDFTLPQQQARLSKGDVVKAVAPGLLDRAIEATIIARDAWVDKQSRNVRYRALATEITNLNPGTIVNVSVPMGQTQTVARLPATAVRYDSFGASVYV